MYVGLWNALQLERRVHGVQEFVGLLTAFSPRASRAQKLQFLFTVHDIDGDGKLSSEDLQLMLRQLAGTSLRYSTSCCYATRSLP